MNQVQQITTRVLNISLIEKFIEIEKVYCSIKFVDN
jgi:hypothetical protein